MVNQMISRLFLEVDPEFPHIPAKPSVKFMSIMLPTMSKVLPLQQ
jgi:hypothetical protein